MSTEDRDESGLVSLLAGIGVGVIIGGVAALLLAPQSGIQTRAQIRETADDALNRLRDSMDDLKHRVEEVAQSAKEAVSRRGQGGSPTGALQGDVAGATGTFTLGAAPPRAPEAPTLLAQRPTTDLSANLAAGATVATDRIAIQATLTDPDLDSLRLELELRPVGTAFSNVASATTHPPAAPGDRPGADNTGPRYSMLETRGGFTADVDGAVYERIRFTGQVNVRADNVTFRDCIFEGSPRYNIEANHDGQYQNLLIEYCELTGASSAMIYGEELTVRYSDIHHGGADGVKPSGSNFLMEYNWIHHLGMSDGSHADGVQARVTSGTWTGLAFIGNYFDMPVGLTGFKSNATIFLQAIEGGRIVDAQIIGNWLNGGNYCVHITGGAAGADFVGNYWGRDYRYGIFKGGEHIGTWSQNTWMESESLISKP